MKYIIDIIMLCMLLIHIYRRLWIDIYIDDDEDDDVWSSRRILQSYGMIYIHDHSYECSMCWWTYNDM